MSSPAGQVPVWDVVPFEHSTYFGFFVKFRKPATEPKMMRPFPKPRNVWTELVRLNSKPALIV